MREKADIELRERLEDHRKELWALFVLQRWLERHSGAGPESGSL